MSGLDPGKGSKCDLQDRLPALATRPDRNEKPKTMGELFFAFFSSLKKLTNKPNDIETKNQTNRQGTKDTIRWLRNCFKSHISLSFINFTVLQPLLFFLCSQRGAENTTQAL